MNLPLEGRLAVGPVWDYDNAFGTTGDYLMDVSTSMQHASQRRGRGCSGWRPGKQPETAEGCPGLTADGLQGKADRRATQPATTCALWLQRSAAMRCNQSAA